MITTPTKKHFFTLPPTLVDALYEVKRYPGLETLIFFNKVKDLAYELKARYIENCQMN